MFASSIPLEQMEKMVLYVNYVDAMIERENSFFTYMGNGLVVLQIRYWWRRPQKRLQQGTRAVCEILSEK